MHNRAAQRQSLLPATGQLCGQLALPTFQSGHRNQLAHAAAEFGAGHIVDAGVEVEVLPYRQVFVQRKPLAHVPDVLLDPFWLREDVVPKYGAATGARREDPAQQADHRALPGAIRAEEREHFAALHGERDVGNGDALAEALREVLSLDGGVRGGRHSIDFRKRLIDTARITIANVVSVSVCIHSASTPTPFTMTARRICT